MLSLKFEYDIDIRVREQHLNTPQNKDAAVFLLN